MLAASRGGNLCLTGNTANADIRTAGNLRSGPRKSPSRRIPSGPDRCRCRAREWFPDASNVAPSCKPRAACRSAVPSVGSNCTRASSARILILPAASNACNPSRSAFPGKTFAMSALCTRSGSPERKRQRHPWAAPLVRTMRVGHLKTSSKNNPSHSQANALKFVNTMTYLLHCPEKGAHSQRLLLAVTPRARPHGFSTALPTNGLAHSNGCSQAETDALLAKPQSRAQREKIRHRNSALLH